MSVRRRPTFPEFCPPLQADSLYELRIKNVEPRFGPQFDERLQLRPLKMLPRRLDGEGPQPPRPPARVEEEPYGPGPATAEGHEVLDPESGEPIANPASFL